MDSDEKYKSNVAFIDLLFNVLIGFVFLFIIAFILINPIAKKGDIIVPAEFLIVLTWPDDLSDDVDLWVGDKHNHIVGFSKKDSSLMFLDRDDLGLTNDVTIINDEKVVVKVNREVVSIRGKSSNEYKVSVHLYRKNASNKGSIPVTVEVVKINPYKIVYKQTKILDAHGQIANFPSFTVTKESNVTDVIEGTESVVPLYSDAPTIAK